MNGNKREPGWWRGRGWIVSVRSPAPACGSFLYSLEVYIASRTQIGADIHDGAFHKWRCPQMAGLQWKIILLAVSSIESVG